ncbi:URC4/urg3 family protein [Azoarcus sp. L1K30]|uniref:URC4/urg3 family protein n=1 Tax=Azoarcus sp. L1K30 TaxID=2820277 RepID=UPI001B84337A|nr:URC4/urg3 family protein [Azoarcus sp. L1K30]MBR0565125.1 URC4/urg3 family protein [Azoarcus sp. L1K30]
MNAAARANSGWYAPVPIGHPATALLSAKAVRKRCAAVMAAVESGRSSFFEWRAEALPGAALYVADTIRHDYPNLEVPYHSRWRHFEAGGVDRWQALRAMSHAADEREIARIAIDLVVPSVLLDAGAGPDWHFRDEANAQVHVRSEGLAVASIELFAAGLLSDAPGRPLRSDAAALSRLTADRLATAFQESEDNPLVGLEGRAGLLRRLGEVISGTPAVFGEPARLGNLVDYLFAHADRGEIDAEFILATLLKALGPVWPGRISLQGISLGDCWHHPALEDELLPFHKLTQWLTYSLLEPLDAAGLKVRGLDALTGLPEYRNGGLLLDLGVIRPRSAEFWTTPWRVDSPPIVEWRALTVIGLDRIANAVRAELGVDEAQFPLPKVLQGGTWSAGRRIAAQRRAGGVPPLTIISDGTVF